MGSPTTPAGGRGDPYVGFLIANLREIVRRLQEKPVQLDRLIDDLEVLTRAAKEIRAGNAKPGTGGLIRIPPNMLIGRACKNPNGPKS